MVATSTKKSTKEDKARIKELLGKDGVTLEKGNPEQLLKVIADTKAEMLIAGGRNQYTALKARIPFLDINQERHHPYAGYVGMVEMARELDEALHSPIWEQVRKVAPWERKDRGAEGQRSESAEKNTITKVVARKKSVAVNPLKQSQPLGAALAFLGLKGVIPLFHGSQGCTAFAKVMLVRHFREAIPLSTTAMTEVATILGGEENIETAILTLVEKSKPEMIGLCTTGLTETRGDDMKGILKSIRKQHPELNHLPIAFASTPDYKGALQDGYAAAVEAIVRDIPPSGEEEVNQADDALFAHPYGYPITGLPSQVTILAGSFLAPGDVQEIKDMVAAFGLKPIVVPDLSMSLDGHLGGDYSATTSGGTALGLLRTLGHSAFTLALGESMRLAAEILQQRFGTEYEVFDRLTSLAAVDQFLLRLSEISGYSVPEKYKRQRCQLQDAILDTHFYFGRKRVSLALEPDLLYSIAWWLDSMGVDIHAAVTTTKSPLLKRLPVETVTIGDLEDLENLAKGSDLLITNSNGAAIARRLNIPLYRLGFPVVDRLGNGQRCSVGYRGAMQLLFDIGNLFLEMEEVSAYEQVKRWSHGDME